MTAPRPSPGRLRRRLAIAFALVGAVSSGLLAIGSYAVVERARTTDAQDRALVQAKANLQLARSAASVEQLQRRLASRPGFATVPVVDGKAQPGTLPVPPDLSRLVGDGNLAYRWATVRGHRYLVVGAPSRGAELYFFFDEQQLQDDLDQLRVILIGAWLVLAALSALVGIVLARRVLAPVGEASAAARALARVCSRRGCPAGAPTSSASGRPRSTRWRTRWRRRSTRCRWPASGSSGSRRTSRTSCARR